MNRFELFDCMVNDAIVTVGVVRGRIQSIELEDGSGYNFNVVIREGRTQTNKTVFVATERPVYKEI